MEQNETLGQRLRRMRKERGLLQKDVANGVETTDRTIGYYEADQRSPDPKMIIKLANFFKVTTDCILGNVDDSMLSKLLTEEEINVLNVFRGDDIRARIMKMLDLASTDTILFITKILEAEWARYGRKV